MPLPEEALSILQSVIETEADAEAFKAGYELSIDPANDAMLGGPVDARYDLGISVTLHMENQTGTWVGDRILPRHGDSVQVNDSAFVLGAVVAGLSVKTDKGLVRPSQSAVDTTAEA